MITKVNFTHEHETELFNLALKALFNKVEFKTSFNTILNIYDLLHTTTINVLLNIKSSLDKTISLKENADEWSLSDVEQKNIAELKFKSRLVNLIIGFKKYKDYIISVEKEKAELNAQLESLKESQKTPADKIKELEDKIKSLDETYSK